MSPVKAAGRNRRYAFMVATLSRSGSIDTKTALAPGGLAASASLMIPTVSGHTSGQLV